MTFGRENSDASQQSEQRLHNGGLVNKEAKIHLAARPTGEPLTSSSAPRSFDLASIEDYMDRLHELKNDLCGAACGIARTVKNWGYDKDVVAVAIDRLIEEAEKYERGLVELTTKGGL